MSHKPQDVAQKGALMSMQSTITINALLQKLSPHLSLVLSKTGQNWQKQKSCCNESLNQNVYLVSKRSNTDAHLEYAYQWAMGKALEQIVIFPKSYVHDFDLILS